MMRFTTCWTVRCCPSNACLPYYPDGRNCPVPLGIKD